MIKQINLQKKFNLNEQITLQNKLVMAPMTTWASNDDQTVSEAEISYYEQRAKQVGMVITGSSHVQENGVGFDHEIGVYEDRFIPGLTKLATAIKAGGAKAILQLNHAGNKALPELITNHDVISASPVPAPKTPFAPAQTPRELTEEELIQVIKSFGTATKRAIQAGFDGVEIHGAHGFLIQNFLSPHYNHRTDQWGGSLENRLRFAMAVVDEVQRVADENTTKEFIIGYRITLEEREADGLKLEDTEALITNLVAKQVSYLHLSLGNALTDGPKGGEPYIQRVSQLVNQRVPIMAAGSLNTFDRATTALKSGLDLVAVGSALVANPNLLNQEKWQLTLSMSDPSIPKLMLKEIQTLGNTFGFTLID